ncbi:MAG: hypothetical protein JWQ40_507 [Segetibacter sp.]|nr:hypothetical protein [Segetibacter sp.]
MKLCHDQLEVADRKGSIRNSLLTNASILEKQRTHVHNLQAET